MNSQLLTGLALTLLLLCTTQPALAQEDRTFADWDVQRARAFWEENARTGGRDCLETINEALRVLYQDRAMKLASTVDLTMAALKRIGRAEAPVVFSFVDPDGRRTRGVTEPVRLERSVWDGLVERGRDQPPGWLMFGFSPLDGYHSIVLTLDNRNPADPQVYWSDQWSSNGGFRHYGSREELDGEIERLTRNWWKGKLSSSGVKFKSDAKLYPMIPSQESPRERFASIARIPQGMGVPLHSEPSVGSASFLRDAEGEVLEVHRGERFPLMGRRGQWASVELPDGRRAWVHSYFVGFADAEPAAPAEADGIEGALTRADGR